MPPRLFVPSPQPSPPMRKRGQPLRLRARCHVSSRRAPAPPGPAGRRHRQDGSAPSRRPARAVAPFAPPRSPSAASARRGSEPASTRRRRAGGHARGHPLRAGRRCRPPAPVSAASRNASDRADPAAPSADRRRLRRGFASARARSWHRPSARSRTGRGRGRGRRHRASRAPPLPRSARPTARSPGRAVTTRREPSRRRRAQSKRALGA